MDTAEIATETMRVTETSIAAVKPEVARLPAGTWTEERTEALFDAYMIVSMKTPGRAHTEEFWEDVGKVFNPAAKVNFTGSQLKSQWGFARKPHLPKNIQAPVTEHDIVWYTSVCQNMTWALHEDLVLEEELAKVRGAKNKPLHDDGWQKVALACADRGVFRTFKALRDRSGSARYKEVLAAHRAQKSDGAASTPIFTTTGEPVRPPTPPEVARAPSEARVVVEPAEPEVNGAGAAIETSKVILKKIARLFLDQAVFQESSLHHGHLQMVLDDTVSARPEYVYDAVKYVLTHGIASVAVRTHDAQSRQTRQVHGLPSLVDPSTLSESAASVGEPTVPEPPRHLLTSLSAMLSDLFDSEVPVAGPEEKRVCATCTHENSMTESDACFVCEGYSKWASKMPSSVRSPVSRLERTIVNDLVAEFSGAGRFAWPEATRCVSHLSGSSPDKPLARVLLSVLQKMVQHGYLTSNGKIYEFTSKQISS